MLPKDIEGVKKHIENYDKLITLFDMKIIGVKEGEAMVKMNVGPDHLNAAKLCHGGAIFSLADVAFALACNSYGKTSLALEVSINYVRPAKLGEELTAYARKLHRGSKTGLYFIEVKNQDNKPVAFLKATSFQIED